MESLLHRACCNKIVPEKALRPESAVARPRGHIRNGAEQAYYE